jgi:hypothetical protein
MLRKLRLLSAAGMLVTLGSAAALAQAVTTTGTYMGPSTTTTATTPTVTGQTTAPPVASQTPAPPVAGQIANTSGSNAAPNNYSPYGAASGTMTGATEGSGTNPYMSGVGTSGHAPGR